MLRRGLDSARRAEPTTDDRLGDRRVDDDTTIKLLSIGFYACWMWFCLPALQILAGRRPAPARTRRASAPTRVVALDEVPDGPRGWLARLARVAVGSATVIVAMSSTAAAHAPAGPTGEPAPRAPVTLDHQHADIARTAAARVEAITVTAEHRDTPYALAMRLFPDDDPAGRRQEIIELNRGRPLPNGAMYRGGAFPVGWDVVVPATRHTTQHPRRQLQRRSHRPTTPRRRRRR